MMMVRHRISCEDIVRYLLEREREGRPLSATAVRLDDASIYYAGCKRFGNWSKTLEAAGLDPFQHARSRGWTPQKIIDLILNLNSRGIPLRRREVLRNDPGLLAAAQIRFGSWQAALEIAGIDPTDYCMQAKWSREQVIEAILLRAVKREPLGSTTVRPSSLKTSAIAEFGSWREALVAAGLNPHEHVGARTQKPAMPNYSTRERVGRALLQRVALGLPCQSQTVRRQNPRLFRAVRRHFKSFRCAFEYAGLSVDEPEIELVVGSTRSQDSVEGAAATTR